MNNDSKFESIYKGKYVELFFFKKNFYPSYKNHYSLDKQRLINHALEVENNLAGNISISKIEDNYELIKRPDDPSVYNYYFALNLSAFENLRTLRARGARFKIKSLPKTLKNLSFYNWSWNAEEQSDLSIFTDFKNLEILDLGMIVHYSDFAPWKGSLESLKDCKNLKSLCIGHITDITGLEYLPLDSLETANLYGTPFDNLLFGDKTLDPNKLTTYSEKLQAEVVIAAIKEYQQNFWINKFQLWKKSNLSSQTVRHHKQNEFKEFILELEKKIESETNINEKDLLNFKLRTVVESYVTENLRLANLLNLEDFLKYNDNLKEQQHQQLKNKINQRIKILGSVKQIERFSTWWSRNNTAFIIVFNNNSYSVFLILIDKKITNKGKIKDNEIFVYPINSDCKWWGEKERGQWSSLELAQKEVNGLITEFTKVNGKYYNNPILLIHPRCGVKTEFVDILACPYVTKEEINLPETEVNFDKYFRVGDIVESEREKFWFFNFYHSAIYLGKNKVCHMLNESNFQGVKINFFNDENYFWKRLSSGRLGKLFLVHPIIPFKHISLIAEQINRTNNNLWKDNYCLHRRNCQHYAYSVSLGINYSWEVWEKRERIAFIDMPFVDYLNDSLKHKKLDEINNGKKDKITLTEEFEETNKLLNINSDIFSNNLVEQIKQNYFEQIIEPIKIDDCLIM